MNDSEAGGNEGRGVTRNPVQNKRKDTSGKREAGVSESNKTVAMVSKKKQTNTSNSEASGTRERG